MMADPRFVLAVSLIITQAAQACIPIFTPPQEPTTAAPTTAINPSGEIHCCNKTRGHQPVSLQSPILTPRVNYCSFSFQNKFFHLFYSNIELKSLYSHSYFIQICLALPTIFHAFSMMSMMKMLKHLMCQKLQKNVQVLKGRIYYYKCNCLPLFLILIAHT